MTGYEVDHAAVEEAIRLSEEKYCSVGAMVKQTAKLQTTYEIVEEKTRLAGNGAGGSPGMENTWIVAPNLAEGIASLAASRWSF